jgi:hypothetical protein
MDRYETYRLPCEATCTPSLATAECNSVSKRLTGLPSVAQGRRSTRAHDSPELRRALGFGLITIRVRSNAAPLQKQRAAPHLLRATLRSNLGGGSAYFII